MKFAGQDKYGYLVIKHLRANGPQTVRELATAFDATIHVTGQALRRMMCRGLIEGTGEYRGEGCYRAQVFRWVDIEDSDSGEPLMDDCERNKAIAASDRAIVGLRAAYIPGAFDPFRVPRAQVA